MSKSNPSILIITGVMAAGKSSVSQAIAETLPRSVHLRGDTFRKMIISGRADVSPEPSQDALEQLSLRYELARNACITYAGAGFSVIYQDVILGEYLTEVAKQLSKFSPGVVVLKPSDDVVETRDYHRSKSAYTDSWTPAKLSTLLNATPDIGLWLDTSQMSVAETAKYILDNLEQTRRGI